MKQKLLVVQIFSPIYDKKKFPVSNNEVKKSFCKLEGFFQEEIFSSTESYQSVEMYFILISNHLVSYSKQQK